MKIYDELLRVSKMNGRKEGDDSTLTIEDQRRANREGVRARRGRIGKTFKALDQSGFDIVKSEAWQAALRRIRSGESHGIVVAYDDRLARNWRKVGAYYDALEEAGADVIIAGMPGVDYRTMEGRAITGMMAVMGDMVYMAAKKRGERTVALMLERKVPNQVPYGYRRNADEDGNKQDPDRDAKALVIHPEEARIVRRIYEMRAAGTPWAVISEALGRTSPRGGHWTHASLASVIRNKTYLGYVVFGSEEKYGRHEIPDCHDAIVSLKLWKAAQSTRTITRSGQEKGGIAAGLLVCASCGKPMQVQPSQPPNYGCQRGWSASLDGRCPRPSYIRAAPVDEWLSAEIEEAIAGEEFRLVTSAREIAAAREALDRATAETKAFVAKASVLDSDDFDEGYRVRKDAETAAREHYEDLVHRAEDMAEIPDSVEAWRALSLERQRRFARLLVDRIEVLPPETRRPPVAERLRPFWRDRG